MRVMVYRNVIIVIIVTIVTIMMILYNNKE